MLNNRLINTQSYKVLCQIIGLIILNPRIIQISLTTIFLLILNSLTKIEFLVLPTAPLFDLDKPRFHLCHTITMLSHIDKMNKTYNNIQ